MKFLISHCTGSCLPICRVAVECSLPVAGHFRYGTGRDLSHENVWVVIEKLSQFPMWKGNNRYTFDALAATILTCRMYGLWKISACRKKNEIVPECQLGVSENSVSLNPMVFMIIIPFLNGYFIGNINPTFSDKPNWPLVIQEVEKAPHLLQWLSQPWCHLVSSCRTPMTSKLRLFHADYRLIWGKIYRKQRRGSAIVTFNQF